eukprot:m.98494 g.98494  ORF g.98494 m.98494 type:complete len:324 (-) comp51407_c0_seq1:80-1051(-)
MLWARGLLLLVAAACACAQECGQGSFDVHVEPLTGTLGAIVHGINLTQELTDEQIAFVRETLLQYKVIFFRDQHIQPKQQVAFARRFGVLTPAHPLVGGLSEDLPEVLVLDSTDYKLGVGSANKKTSYNNRWHTDVTFSPTPPAMTVLSAKKIPTRGGDTLWCDLEDAYQTLSAPLRSMLDSLIAVHSARSTFARYQTDDPDGTQNKRMASQDPVRHPVVRVHPETMRPGLFVNPTFTNNIEGFNPEESSAILQLLYQHSILPERVVRWHWRTGDIAMWDNRSTAHYASADYTEPRLMHRVTVAGSRPLGLFGLAENVPIPEQ